MTEQCTPFGLDWGVPHSDVRSRFSRIRPVADAEHAVVYETLAVAELIWAQGAFCPKALNRDPKRSGDEVVFEFTNGHLVSVLVQLGFGFDCIGQDPDTLSEQAMSSFARAEMHDLVAELTTRHGPPILFSESQSRARNLHVLGSAIFRDKLNGTLHLIFGHDGGGALAGELRYRMPCSDQRGF